jgi:hypothetical protein
MSAIDQEKLIWNEWRRITRFVGSSRIAFSREELIWSSLEIPNKKEIILSTKVGQSAYSVNLRDHLVGIQDHQALFSTVLLASYALTESYARLKLGLSDEEELTGGIESWGAKILAITGNSWPKVMHGLHGIVEVAAVRGAIAHGLRNVNQSMVKRFSAHSMTPPWAVGDKIELTNEKFEQFRARLRSLMRLSSKGPRSVAPASMRGK